VTGALPDSEGPLYGADIAGGALAALGTGIFLIPLWGVGQVFVFCGVLQAVVALSGKIIRPTVK